MKNRSFEILFVLFAVYKKFFSYYTALIKFYCKCVAQTRDLKILDLIINIPLNHNV